MGKTIDNGRKAGSGRPLRKGEPMAQIWVGVTTTARDKYRALRAGGYGINEAIESLIDESYKDMNKYDECYESK